MVKSRTLFEKSFDSTTKNKTKLIRAQWVQHFFLIFSINIGFYFKALTIYYKMLFIKQKYLKQLKRYKMFCKKSSDTPYIIKKN